MSKLFETTGQIHIDASAIPKEVMAAAKNAQQTLDQNQPKMNIAVDFTGMSKQDIKETADYYRKQIDKIKDLSEHLKTKRKSSTLDVKDLLREYLDEAFYDYDSAEIKGKEAAQKYLMAFQAVISHGLPTNKSGRQNLALYESLSNIAGYLDPKEILPFQEQITKTTAVIELMEDKLVDASKGIKQTVETGAEVFEDAEKQKQQAVKETTKQIEKEQKKQEELFKKSVEKVKNAVKEYSMENEGTSGDVMYHRRQTPLSSKSRKGETLDRLGDAISSEYGGQGSGIYLQSDVYDVGDGNHFYAVNMKAIRESSKLLELTTEEQATDVLTFFNLLQRYCMSLGGFEGYSEDLQGVNPQTLYNGFETFFKEINMTYDEFLSYIEEMKIVAKNAGELEILNDLGDFKFKDASGIEQTDSYTTRLLKSKGYEGVYFDPKSGYNNESQGSVIFDVQKVLDNLIKFKDRDDMELFDEKVLENGITVFEEYKQKAVEAKSVIEQLGDSIDEVSKKSSNKESKVFDDIKSSAEDAKSSVEDTKSSLEGLLSIIGQGSLLSSTPSDSDKTEVLSGDGISKPVEEASQAVSQFTNDVQVFVNGVKKWAKQDFLVSIPPSFKEEFEGKYFKDKSYLDEASTQARIINNPKSTPARQVDAQIRLKELFDESERLRQSYEDTAKVQNNLLDSTVPEVNQTPLSLIEESSGQLALFEGVEKQQEKIEETVKETNQVIEGQIDLLDYLSKQEAKTSEPTKDTFDASVESAKMEKVETATEQAVQAKKDFAMANEGVQDSVDGSKSKLQLEAELMESIAKNARDAAKAKADFVKANKEVKESADSSSESLDKESKSMDGVKDYAKEATVINNKKAGEIERLNSNSKTTSNVKRLATLAKRGEIDTTEYKNLMSTIEDIVNLQGEYTEAVNASGESVNRLKQASKNFSKNFISDFKNNREFLYKSFNATITNITEGKNFNKSDSKIVKNLEDDLKALYDFKLNNIDDVKILVQLIERISTGIKDVKGIPKENLLPNASELYNDLSKINGALSGGYKISRELRQEYKALQKAYQDAFDSNGNVKITNKELQKMRDLLSKVTAEFDATGKKKSLFGSFGQRLTDMNTKFLAQYFSWQDWIRYARTAFETIKDLDTAFTEMRKVSDESVKSLKDFQKVSFDIANTVGTTAIQIQNSTADWMRLGESLKEATESAKVSNILLNVSEFDNIDSATESLVSMSQAYKELEKIDIVDIMNEVGNNYSISTNELATALQKSAATLKVAGNDIYEATALITAGNAILQDADTVGTGLKMISLRILGTEEAKDELASLGEDVDDFVVQTKSKIDETVRNYTAVASNGFKGISVLDESGNYRSTYEILRDISKVYQEILEADKKAGTNRGQALLEVLAGEKFCLKFMETYIYRTHLIARIA